MKNRQFLRVALPLVAAALAGIGWILLERPHRDIGAEPARFRRVPTELSSIMAASDSVSMQHLNAVVELTGVVSSDDGTRVTFDGGVVALWDSTRTHRSFQKGDFVRVKGRVTGYDDLFEEVRMDGLVLMQATDPSLEDQ